MILLKKQLNNYTENKMTYSLRGEINGQLVTDKQRRKGDIEAIRSSSLFYKIPKPYY